MHTFTRHSTRLLVAVVVVLSWYSASTPVVHAQSITCTNTLTSSTAIPTGYGASYNPLTSAREYLVQASCTGTTQATVTAGNGNPLTYVYNRGYYYSGTTWTPYTLTCASGALIGGAWCPGRATASIPLPQNPTNVIAYTCQYTNNTWKCGCRDATCSTAYWQLQRVGVTQTDPPTTFKPPFPRLASGQIGGHSNCSDTRYRNIAKHHVAVFGPYAGWTCTSESGKKYTVETLPAQIRALNPNIRLFQYTGVAESYSNGHPEILAKVNAGKGPNGQGDWWLRNASGEHVSSWQGTWRINHSALVTPDASGQRYPEWFASWWLRQLGAGQWDGIYSDVQSVDALVTASWDGNGNRTRLDPLAVRWHTDGHVAYKNAWAKLKPNWMFMGNMIDQLRYLDPNYANGVTFPSAYRGLNNGGWFEGMMGYSWSAEVWSGWDTTLKWYHLGMSILKEPKIGIFHNDTEYGLELGFSEYRWNRYGLTTALLGDGYYMVSPNGNYGDQKWYDEFDIKLGYAIDPPQTAPWSNGVYRRRFENGMALVYPRTYYPAKINTTPRTVTIEPGYRRFLGTQDPVHNNGQLVTTLTLNPGDGIILVRE